MTQFHKRHAKCSDCVNTYLRAWRKNNKELAVKADKRAAYKLRNKVFSHYGSECICCGEDLLEGLSIDHINGDGAAHRKSVKGYQFYRWLIKNNFPPGFQTLCMTCNFAKGRKKFCPHQSRSG